MKTLQLIMPMCLGLGFNVLSRSKGLCRDEVNCVSLRASQHVVLLGRRIVSVLVALLNAEWRTVEGGCSLSVLLPEAATVPHAQVCLLLASLLSVLYNLLVCSVAHRQMESQTAWCRCCVFTTTQRVMLTKVATRLVVDLAVSVQVLKGRTE